ncbi:LysR family transcriptional regulator [Chelativorans sp.]|uniref:LysR family transcriptional regulator n=1 Tax=Chelativorans sp. TaxID=2203393 RepID=UPI0028114CAD|nr:LysR family transcriptional regulator [Chelativorans sp.]
MDVLGLQAFIQIAESGSFRGAAVAMNLSQTALSHRIKKLEADVGVSLFQRTTRTLTLTRAGQEFFPKAREMMMRLNSLYDSLKIEGQKAHERVSIGCLGSLGELYLPRVLRLFREQNPDTDVVIYDEHAAMLSDRVAAGEVQFALTILGAQRWAEKQRRLYDEDFVAAVPADHALADRQELTWAELAGHRLARVSNTTSHGVILSESLGEVAHQLNWCYEVQRTYMAGALVLGGLAITVLPRAAIPVSDSLRIIPIRNPTVKRTVGIISQEGVPLPPKALQLQRILLREIARAQKVRG